MCYQWLCQIWSWWYSFDDTVWIYDTVRDATSFLSIFIFLFFRLIVIWDLNGYGEYEFDWCICDKVMACTSVGVRLVSATKNIIPAKFSNFGDIIKTYKYSKIKKSNKRVFFHFWEAIMSDPGVPNFFGQEHLITKGILCKIIKNTCIYRPHYVDGGVSIIILDPSCFPAIPYQSTIWKYVRFF